MSVITSKSVGSDVAPARNDMVGEQRASIFAASADFDDFDDDDFDDEFDDDFEEDWEDDEAEEDFDDFADSTADGTGPFDDVD